MLKKLPADVNDTSTETEVRKDATNSGSSTQFLKWDCSFRLKNGERWIFKQYYVWTWNKIKLPGNPGSQYLILLASSKLSG